MVLIRSCLRNLLSVLIIILLLDINELDNFSST